MVLTLKSSRGSSSMSAGRRRRSSRRDGDGGEERELADIDLSGDLTRPIADFFLLIDGMAEGRKILQRALS